jgi:hypothetical protein
LQIKGKYPPNCGGRAVFVADIEFNLDEEAFDCLSLMAKEAEMSNSEMAQIAVFNLIAIYLKQHGIVESGEGEEEIRKSPV